MGKANRIRFVGTYELDAVAEGATRVAYTLETEVHVPSDRLFEALGQRGWWRRKNGRALRRLRSIIEHGKGAGERVTVAGR
jgi:hypothetical protein